MKVAITALSLLAPAYSGMTSDLKDYLLDRHNALRQATAAGQTVCYGGNCPGTNYMPDLLWDDGLALLAQDYADKCSWGHESNDAREERFINLGGSSNFDGHRAGENLASGSCSLTPGNCLATTRWGVNEAVDYKHDADGGQCYGVCGHFTQVLYIAIE